MSMRGMSYPVRVLDKKRALPRMTWGPENLYNLWQRSEGDLQRETNFLRTTKTLFQQRWLSKRLARGYHGDHIGDTKFTRWYLPENLPSISSAVAPSSSSKAVAATVAGRTRGGGRSEEEKRREGQDKDGRAPVGTMLFREVERRLDVLIFRACFARSVWQARQFVVHRKVKVNGHLVTNPNIRLNPGDLFSIEPSAIPMLALPPSSPPKLEESEPEAEAEADAAETAPSSLSSKSTEAPSPPPRAAFTLPPYSAPFLFIPAYLECSFKTCSAVYVRHPTARAGYSEIPSPFDADGDVMARTWEWFKRRAPNMSKRRDRWMSPERQTDRKSW